MKHLLEVQHVENSYKRSRPGFRNWGRHSPSTSSLACTGRTMVENKQERAFSNILLKWKQKQTWGKIIGSLMRNTFSWDYRSACNIYPVIWGCFPNLSDFREEGANATWKVEMVFRLTSSCYQPSSEMRKGPGLLTKQVGVEGGQESVSGNSSSTGNPGQWRHLWKVILRTLEQSVSLCPHEDQ